MWLFMVRTVQPACFFCRAFYVRFVLILETYTLGRDRGEVKYTGIGSERVLSKDSFLDIGSS